MPKRNPKAFRVKGPGGEIYAYGATEREAWHNFYMKEKRAGRVDDQGHTLSEPVPLGGSRKKSSNPFGFDFDFRF